jgi:CubicO group peptidase (beta-lactamase class C family)
VAHVSGQDFHTYVRQNVLDPMDLHQTFSTMEKEKHGNELAVGYESMPRQGERKPVQFFNAGVLDPAAGFTSSANDLAKFLMWQIKLQGGEGDEVLNHNTLREMQRPHSVIMDWKEAVGIGFFIRKSGKKTIVEHGGYCPGYRSQAAFDLDKGIGGVALINAGGTNPTQIIERMMDIFGAINKTASDVKEPSVAEIQVTDVSDYSGIYNVQPWGDEVFFTSWGGQLVKVDLATANPLASMTKYKLLNKDTFITLRDDGSEAHLIKFIRTKDGGVESFFEHSNIYEIAIG